MSCPGTQVGEVLQESSRIALSWVRAHFAALERDPQSIAASEGQPSNRLPTAVSSASAAQHSDRHNPMSWDVHLHLPAGAVQKVSHLMSTQRQVASQRSCGTEAVLKLYNIYSRTSRQGDRQADWQHSAFSQRCCTLSDSLSPWLLREVWTLLREPSASPLEPFRMV
jgi:hypothetical protein